MDESGLMGLQIADKSHLHPRQGSFVDTGAFGCHPFALARGADRKVVDFI